MSEKFEEIRNPIDNEQHGRHDHVEKFRFGGAVAIDPERDIRIELYGKGGPGFHEYQRAELTKHDPQAHWIDIDDDEFERLLPRDEVD